MFYMPRWIFLMEGKSLGVILNASLFDPKSLNVYVVKRLRVSDRDRDGGSAKPFRCDLY